jgi:hypothetical protein
MLNAGNDHKQAAKAGICPELPLNVLNAGNDPEIKKRAAFARLNIP